MNYFTFIFPFESGKCGKDRKKIQKRISRERKELFR